MAQTFATPRSLPGVGWGIRRTGWSRRRAAHRSARRNRLRPAVGGAGNGHARQLPGRPDPGGDENAAVTVPPPGGKYFGLNDDYVDYAHHQSPESYAKYAYSAGGNAVKLSLEWWRAERFEDDQWIERRWQVWQDVYDAMRARGITPVFILSAAPCWARSVACTPGDATEHLRFPPRPGFDDEWGEFVAEVARRMPESIIQAWNEPNLLIWWRDGVNPERYVQVLQAAKNAVEAVETELGGIEIPISGPGVTNALTDADAGPNNMTMSAFLSRAFTAGMANHTDATSFNVFPLAHAPFGPNQEFGAGTRFAESFRQLRAARTAAGDTDPIFVTETGIVAQFPGSPPFPYTEPQQAVSMNRLYNRLMTMPDVNMMISHRMIEPRDINPDQIEWGFSWLRYAEAPAGQDPQTQAPGLPQPKTVYCLFSHIAYLSSGATDATRDPERFYEPCGIVITDSQDNGDGTWTFTYGAPNYTLLSDLQCRVDAAPFGPCDSFSQHTTAPLGAGIHTFRVRPLDFSGNPLPATVLSFPDNSAPTASFLPSSPANGSTVFDSTPTFEFASNEPGTFECRLDGRAAVACASPWTLKPEDALSDAVHTLNVVAIDEAGNRSAAIQRSFTVEAAIPVVTITSGPAEGSTVSDPTVTITFAASEAATFRCSVDSTVFGPCSGPGVSHTTPALSDDSDFHYIGVRATDQAGNASTDVFRSFIVEEPDAKITRTKVSASRRTATVKFKATAGATPSTFECKIDDKNFKSCDSPKKFKRLKPGRHKVQVQAISADGVTDPSPAKERFKVPRRG